MLKDLKVLEKNLSTKPAFKTKQAKEAFFKKLIKNWNEATNLSLDLREELNDDYPLEIKSEVFESSQGDTVKFLIELSDKLKIESVLMRNKIGRNTVCVSSMVGCPVGCVFCATGRMGFKRNLEPMEMVGQVILISRYLKKLDEKVHNIVFMGMGEPFLNYDNVLHAVNILNSNEGLNIGARHISISTVGITEGIKKLAKESLQLNLAISLHAPDDTLRSKLIPISKKNSVKNIIESVDRYLDKAGRKVMIEYLMIDRVNDSLSKAKKLVEVLDQLERKLYFVNLIPYNKTGELNPSSRERIEGFKKYLKQ